jgi:hypothetical protein
MCLSSLTLAVQAAVPPADIGPATTTATFLRTIGGVLGVCVASVILQNVVISSGPTYLTPIAIQYQLSASTVEGCMKAIANGEVSCPGVSADAFNQMDAAASSMYAEGLRMVFVCTVPYSILAFVAVLFMKHVPLRKQADTLKLKTSEDLTDVKISHHVEI